MPQLPAGDRRALSAIITAILWNIWKSRNDFVFNSINRTPMMVVRSVVDDLKLWRCRLPVDASTALLEFCNRYVN